MPEGPVNPAPIPAELDAASNRIIGCAIEVHRYLGPGLLESVYERALMHEFHLQGLKASQQVPRKRSIQGFDDSGPTR
jgi:GxxExxY protein